MDSSTKHSYGLYFVILCLLLILPWSFVGNCLGLLLGYGICKTVSEDNNVKQKANVCPVAPMVTLVGNIGAGKSTLLEKIDNIVSHAILIGEPLEKWKRFLNQMPSPFANLQLQTSSIAHYLSVNLSLTNAPFTLHVVERDFLSMMLFGKDMEEHCELIKNLIANNSIKIWLPSVVVYVDTKPAVCLQNIANRNQAGDKAITAENIYALDSLHQILMTLYTEFGVPVIKVSDYDCDMDAIREAYNTVEKHKNQPQPLQPKMVDLIFKEITDDRSLEHASLEA